MGEIRYKLDRNCRECEDKLRDFLKEDKYVENWDIGTINKRKFLKVEGRELFSQHVEEILEKAGIKVEGQL